MARAWLFSSWTVEVLHFLVCEISICHSLNCSQLMCLNMHHVLEQAYLFSFTFVYMLMAESRCLVIIHSNVRCDLLVCLSICGARIFQKQLIYRCWFITVFIIVMWCLWWLKILYAYNLNALNCWDRNNWMVMKCTGCSCFHYDVDCNCI
jgi:hypothetical protein